jgi:hypothetical protein
VNRHLIGVKCSLRQKGDPETDNEYHISCKECLMTMINKRKAASEMQ